MSISYEDFITAKIWALLHDPPHKGLVLSEHEELSRRAVNTFLGQAIPEHIRELVRRADRFASTIERTISTYIKGLDDLRSEYVNVLNIFDTRYEAYDRDHIEKARQFYREWFERFLHNLDEIRKETSLAPLNVMLDISYFTPR